MLMTNSSTKKHIMWYKVNQLIEQGLNKSQISRHLSLHRQTVGRYSSMDEASFLSSNCYRRHVASSLDPYLPSVLGYLDFCQDMSSSQIHDRLREDFVSLPVVHPNTVFNYVQRVRQEHHLPKKDDSSRAFIKIPDSEYGEFAQVDFGEKWVYTANKRSVKIYFFALVMCRSRYKYIYLQRTPFTTKTSIYAHEMAFEYLGGVPHKIIYDQDKVFIHSENLGDYLLTTEFRGFASKYHFQTIFCRKSDPQSKGKVENVVKYVKNNFLKGRAFTDIESLNIQAVSWLERTGNGLTHHGTKLIPSEVYKRERSHLLSYVGTPHKVEEVMKTYRVRKDNTICYRSNYYSLPLGTYKKGDCDVYLSIDKDRLIIYDIESGKVITTHHVSSDRGKLVSHPDHRKRDRTTVVELEKEVLIHFQHREEVKLYLDSISQTKARYYLDNLRYLHRNMQKYKIEDIVNVIIEQLNNNTYNCSYLFRSLRCRESNKEMGKEPEAKIVTTPKHISLVDITPEKRDINSYNSVL